MKYCLSSRQSQEYLLQADQIKVKFKDREIIEDYSKEYPSKELVLELPPEKLTESEWQEVIALNTLTKNNLIICVRHGEDLIECKKNNIKNFYYGYALGSFYDLNALAKLGVCYLIADVPAFFQMPQLKKFNIPLRAVPNIAHYDFIPHETGICGRWIRPEDVDIYEYYISVFEFEDADIEKEKILFDIYAKDKKWSGDLNLIISNLSKFPVPNNYIAKDIGQFRLTCGQRCQAVNVCNICPSNMELASKLSNKPTLS